MGTDYDRYNFGRDEYYTDTDYDDSYKSPKDLEFEAKTQNTIYIIPCVYDPRVWNTNKNINQSIIWLREGKKGGGSAYCTQNQAL